MTPTYQDITADVRAIRWWSGRDSDLGDPQPGGMELVMANHDRRYDPGNPSAIFTDILHRFRLTIGDGQGQGLYNLLDTQVGNAEFDADITGTSQAGGGVVTRTWDTTRSKSPTGALKIVTDGGASGQGAFHNKRSGSRFDATAGATYSAAAFFSGDGGQTVRIGLEFLDGASASLGTTFSSPQTVQTAFTRLDVTAVAPVGTVTARVRTGFAITTAGTIWVDTVGLWESAFVAPYPQGVWYATDYAIDYPDKSLDYSEVTVTCVDGFELLSLDNLESLDPPEASSYSDVIDYNQPSLYARLGEGEGTKMVSHSRKVRHRRKGKDRFTHRHWKTRETAAEVEGQAGPAGTYKGLPTLGVPGLILGDSDTAVQFDGVNDYARIGPLDQDDLSATKRWTIEAWVKPASLPSGVNEDQIIEGPNNTGTAGTPFALALRGVTDGSVWVVYFTPSDGTSRQEVFSTTPGAVGVTQHLVGTWSGSSLKVFVNGTLEGTTNTGKDPENPSANQYLTIAAVDGPGQFFNGTIDEVAIYERALEPDTILDHYTAGSARGFPAQAAGARIADISTSSLWSVAGIQTSGLTVQTQMKFGQARLDEIRAAVASEATHNHFYFDGAGNPIYKGWEYASGAGVEATFTDDGTGVGYEGIEIDFDNEVYNTVITSVDGGLAQTAVDASSVSTKRTRINDSFTGLTLQDDADAALLGRGLLDEFKEGLTRPLRVSVSGATAAARAQIFTLQIGDLVRVQRLAGSDPIDRLCRVLGYEKAISTDKHLTCTFNLSRGLDPDVMHLGVEGYSELGSTFVLA